LVKWTATAIAASVLAIGVAGSSGCSSSATTPANPTVSVQTIARGAVETLEAAWLLGAKGCLTVAITQQSDTIRQQCEDVFGPARDGILAVAGMVDAWTAADQANIPCALQDLVTAFRSVPTLLTKVGVTVPAEVAQGIELAAAIIPQCVTPDAGPPAPSPAPPATPAGLHVQFVLKGGSK
jgi:hypothetical protein